MPVSAVATEAADDPDVERHRLPQPCAAHDHDDRDEDDFDARDLLLPALALEPCAMTSVRKKPRTASATPARIGTADQP
jgi:hypothetical protein